MTSRFCDKLGPLPLRRAAQWASQSIRPDGSRVLFLAVALILVCACLSFADPGA
jgi:hypothetical protein